jgi:hypothetical protein
MSSGKPFTAREIEFVRQNMHEKYPSVIARALGQYYPEDNGGSRSTKSVSILMTRLRHPDQKQTRVKKTSFLN